MLALESIEGILIVADTDFNTKPSTVIISAP